MDFSPYLQWLDAMKPEMVSTLIRWANINSHTSNIEGLETLRQSIADEFGPLGVKASAIELPPAASVDLNGDPHETPLGKALRMTLRPEAKLRIFLGIHMDTVYPVDHAFQKCEAPGETTLNGPGVADAKGGIVVMLMALKAFERSPWKDSLGFEIVINPDEEIGSPGSQGLFKQAAQRNRIGLVFEPGRSDGSMVSGRKGSGNFTVVAHGRAAHAGRAPQSGRNAINALAEFILDLNRFPTSPDGTTINVALIRGGGPSNVVPDLAACRFNVRVTEEGAQYTFERHLSEVCDRINELDGISLDLHGGFGRPPKPINEGISSLMGHFTACGDELGLSLDWAPSGGACDGNSLNAYGLPNLDSLGACGGELHSAREYVLLDSLVERSKLTALLLMKIAAGAISLDAMER